MNLLFLFLFCNIFISINSVTICDVLKSINLRKFRQISPLPYEFGFFNSFLNISQSSVLRFIVQKCPNYVPEIVYENYRGKIMIIDCVYENHNVCIENFKKIVVKTIVDSEVTRRCFVFVLVSNIQKLIKISSEFQTSKWSNKLHGTIIKISPKNGQLLSSMYIRPLLNSCSILRNSQFYAGNFEIKNFHQKLLGIERKCNFKGKIITAAITRSEFCDFEIASNKTIVLKPSVDLNVVKILSEMFNFSIRGIDAKGDYGDRLDNGTWTGLVGMVVNGEAQLALCDFIYTFDRIQVLDFDCSWSVEPVTFLTRAPGFQDRKWQFVEVFPLILWLTIVGLFFLMWTFLHIFDRSSTFSYGFLLISVAIGQSFTSLAQSHLKEFKPRLLIGLWALIAFILAQLYIGIFHSRITIPARARAIETVSEVRNAADKDAALVYTTRFLRNMAFRAECCDSFDWSLGQHLRRNPMPEEIAALESKLDSLNSYRWNPEKPLVFITSSRILYLYSAYARIPVHVSKASFMQDVLGLAIQKDALFGGHFALAIRYLLESGFFVHWNRQMINKHEARGRKIQKQNKQINNSNKESKLRAFRLEELQSVFILYIMFNLLAILIFLFQIIIYSYKKQSIQQ